MAAQWCDHCLVILRWVTDLSVNYLEIPFVRSYACLNTFKTTLISNCPANCELQATISFLMQKKTWNLSTFTGLSVKTMVKRLWALEWQEPLRLEQLKMTKIMFTMKGEVMIVSQSEEKYPMWKFKKTRLIWTSFLFNEFVLRNQEVFVLYKNWLRSMTCHWVSVFLVYSNERMKHSV